MVETSFIHPTRSPSVASEQSPRHSSRTRRRGADSADHRLPSELLKEIGIAGTEVVKVLKGRDGRTKGEDTNRGEGLRCGGGRVVCLCS
ncbi:hypothetical protein JG687_00006895 [Phytophthora cactorum]|uniref:Uncharacterized protein n=1 Tax=Phytophthora cactorum TaxID=29920 RepID=A0A8T1UIB7_9STRA|nr:hypothetical protein GQ600_21681 [Phytophthora cactorum]KAG6962861.1 hypothetical protein JG687_00006895 [Phytophthora cactorum]